jgi:peptidoglycan/LPS O-acetylase OafA/YrhL
MGVIWVGYASIHANRSAYSALDKLAAFASVPFQYGYSGLILFFLISGFCIHWPYATGKAFRAGEYAHRRFWRIVPPYLVAVLLATAGLWLVHPRLSAAPHTILLSFLMLQNYDLSNPHFPKYWDMQIPTDFALWSLPIEVEFYLCYPIVIALSRRFSFASVYVVVAAISLITSIASLLFPHAFLFPDFLPLWTVWLSGAALAEFVANETLPTWNWLMSLVALFSLLIGLVARRASVHLDEIVEDYAWTALFALVMIRILSFSAWHPYPSSLFFRISSFLGKISYSLYLSHFLTLYVILSICTVVFGGPPSNYFIVFALTFLTIPVAYVFWRYVERPSIALAKRLSQPQGGSMLRASKESI